MTENIVRFKELYKSSTEFLIFSRYIFVEVPDYLQFFWLQTVTSTVGAGALIAFLSQQDHRTVQLQYYGKKMLTAHILVKKTKNASYCNILCDVFHSSFVRVSFLTFSLRNLNSFVSFLEKASMESNVA